MPFSFHSHRLIYRAPEDTPEDKVFLHALRSDRTAAENSSRQLIKPLTPADVDAFLRRLSEHLLGVLICIRDPSHPTGITPIGYVKLSPTVLPHRNSMMSIQIAQAEQGKGYGAEAIKWALEWAFQAAGLHRVSIGCFSFNEGARRLYERLGFVVEGRTREAVWKNGGWHDLLEMGMLEGEWRERYLIGGKGAFEFVGGGTGTPIGSVATNV
jgi:RimJ/RimL family protein N-acetyltransferase